MDKNVYATITGVPMGFEAFVETMRERLQDRYPDCNARTVHVDKNNGVHLTGIVILPEGQNVTPNIYMEDFYREYLTGRPIESIVADAARLYEGNKLQEDFTLPDMTDFEAVKGLICFRLINRERNREKLQSMPHRDFLDLAVIYFVPVPVGGGMGGSITIADHIFRLWQTDEETVYQYALENAVAAADPYTEETGSLDAIRSRDTGEFDFYLSDGHIYLSFDTYDLYGTAYGGDPPVEVELPAELKAEWR